MRQGENSTERNQAAEQKKTLTPEELDAVNGGRMLGGRHIFCACKDQDNSRICSRNPQTCSSDNPNKRDCYYS
jgi:hypothetical protein